MRVQTIAQDRRVGRRLDIDAREASAHERFLGRRALTRRAEFARSLGIRRRHVKARRSAAVAHQKRTALLQTTKQVHDRYAFTDPITRLHDEAAHLTARLGRRPRRQARIGRYAHTAILPPRRALRGPQRRKIRQRPPAVGQRYDAIATGRHICRKSTASRLSSVWCGRDRLHHHPSSNSASLANRPSPRMFRARMTPSPSIRTFIGSARTPNWAGTGLS